MTFRDTLYLHRIRQEYARIEPPWWARLPMWAEDRLADLRWWWGRR